MQKPGISIQRLRDRIAAVAVPEDTRFQDYVIVHELLHIRIPTHGRLFKALMSAHVPGWRELEDRSRTRHAAAPKRTASISSLMPTGCQVSAGRVQ